MSKIFDASSSYYEHFITNNCNIKPVELIEHELQRNVNKCCDLRFLGAAVFLPRDDGVLSVGGATFTNNIRSANCLPLGNNKQ